VLSWQGAHLLPDCLHALQRQEPRPHIVVIDNGSTDGTAALVQRDFPDVQLLQLPHNLGYGRGNNEGLQLALDAGAEFVALINNDVEVQPGWLQGLLDAAAERTDAGLFTGTLIFRHEDLVNSTGITIDPYGRARDRDFRTPVAELQRADGPVQGVSGGACLLRSSMLREIGLFDPEYFAYYEDVELSLRAAEKGWASYFVRKAVALHRFGATFGPGSPRQRYLLARGHLRTVALHQPLLKAAALVPGTVAFRLWIKAPLDLLRGRPTHAFAEVRGAASGGLTALRAFADRLRKPR
jgi:GT2 family glycosyltransferase